MQLAEELGPLDGACFFSMNLEAKYLSRPLSDLSAKPFLDKSYALPDSAFLFSDSKSLAKVKMGWHEEGLAFEFDIASANKSASLDLFIDSRDLKFSSSLTRFSHHFHYDLKEGEFVGEELTPLRNADQRPLADPCDLLALFEKKGKEGKLYLWLPAGALFSYDPKQSPSLGFTYRLRLGSEVQYFSSSDLFHIDQRPQVWSSVKLSR